MKEMKMKMEESELSIKSRVINIIVPLVSVISLSVFFGFLEKANLEPILLLKPCQTPALTEPCL